MGLPLNDMGRHPVLHDSATLMPAVVASIELWRLSANMLTQLAFVRRRTILLAPRYRDKADPRSRFPLEVCV